MLPTGQTALPKLPCGLRPFRCPWSPPALGRRPPNQTLERVPVALSLGSCGESIFPTAQATVPADLTGHVLTCSSNAFSEDHVPGPNPASTPISCPHQGHPTPPSLRPTSQMPSLTRSVLLSLPDASSLNHLPDYNQSWHLSSTWLSLTSTISPNPTAAPQCAQRFAQGHLRVSR